MVLFLEYCVISISVTNLRLTRFLFQLGELNLRVYLSQVLKSKNIFLTKWNVYWNSQKLGLSPVDNWILNSVIYEVHKSRNAGPVYHPGQHSPRQTFVHKTHRANPRCCSFFHTGLFNDTKDTDVKYSLLHYMHVCCHCCTTLEKPEYGTGRKIKEQFWRFSTYFVLIMDDQRSGFLFLVSFSVIISLPNYAVSHASIFFHFLKLLYFCFVENQIKLLSSYKNFPLV